MAESLDMSLEDIIKSNKKGNSSSGGGGRRREGRRGSAAAGSGAAAAAAGGVGPNRRAFKRSGNRAAPYQPPKAPESAWQHDMYSDASARGGGGGRVSAIETGTKLLITNLDFGVSTEDLKELFSELGDVKRCLIHYDRSGRSKGTAEVIFARRGDAVAALRKYNNVQLDGKPMKIEILGTNTPTAPAALPTNNGSYARNVAKSAPRGVSASLPQNRPRARGGRGRRGGGGGSGSGGRRGKERSQPRSAEELDAELEKYHAQGTTPMQTTE
ncbi:THO complex subunit 4A-like [Triticum urartu]|uniref:RRM domain-containing protein n=1 Tax=Triticum urartu TaxID=4572 RepID=A0A8R7U8P4_TRIUA|nr:THO complex subunit 4A-like [Triticum dicoccoides]XP_048571562.1 THO complex subunit 4A-like [Triticum urartu]